MVSVQSHQPSTVSVCWALTHLPNRPRSESVSACGSGTTIGATRRTVASTEESCRPARNPARSAATRSSPALSSAAIPLGVSGAPGTIRVTTSAGSLVAVTTSGSWRWGAAERSARRIWPSRWMRMAATGDQANLATNAPPITALPECHRGSSWPSLACNTIDSVASLGRARRRAERSSDTDWPAIHVNASIFTSGATRSCLVGAAGPSPRRGDRATPR